MTTPSALKAPQPRSSYRPGRFHARLIRLVRRRPLLVGGALVALHLLLAFLTFDPTPHTGGDNGAYITLGRSLVESGTYTERWDPAEPPHTKYPPVFPLVLGLGMALGLQPWAQLKLLVIGLSATAVAFTFLWLRARHRAALALGVSALVAVAPGVLREGRWLLSDVPFFAFTMIAVWAFDRLRQRPQAQRALVAATTATLLAYFTRSAGLPLVVAGLGWLAWRRRWVQFAGLGGAVGVPALLWWLRSRAFGTSGYVSEFWLVDPYYPMLGTIGVSDAVQRISDNIVKYVSIHLPVLVAGRPGALLTLLGALVFLLAAAGWLARMKRASVAELFLPLYLGLILVWPAVWSGERFLLPALPFLLYYAGEAVVRMGNRFRPGGGFALAAGGAALLLVLALPGLAAAVRHGTECTGRYFGGERYPCLPSFLYDDFFDAAEVAGQALPDGAVVMNRKPRLFHVLADGVQAINYPMSEDHADFFAAADAAGSRYVLFDQLDAVAEVYLRPVLVRKARGFCLLRVWEGGTVLFGILPGAAEAPDLTPADLEADGGLNFSFCPADYWRSAEAQQRFQGI